MVDLAEVPCLIFQCDECRQVSIRFDASKSDPDPHANEDFYWRKLRAAGWRDSKGLRVCPKCAHPENRYIRRKLDGKYLVQWGKYVPEKLWATSYSPRRIDAILTKTDQVVVVWDATKYEVVE